ncbi:MAG TPA: AzlD domain-containing protein [Ktedonobacteraceae bacterium]
MQINLQVLLITFGMALVTYLTRVGGLWLMSNVTLSGRIKTWLGYLPGAVVVAIVAPAVLGNGLAEMGAALATVLVAVRTRNVLLSMVIGVGVVLGLRTLLADFR